MASKGSGNMKGGAGGGGSREYRSLMEKWAQASVLAAEASAFQYHHPMEKMPYDLEQGRHDTHRRYVDVMKVATKGATRLHVDDVRAIVTGLAGDGAHKVELVNSYGHAYRDVNGGKPKVLVNTQEYRPAVVNENGGVLKQAKFYNTKQKWFDDPADAVRYAQRQLKKYERKRQ